MLQLLVLLSVNLLACQLLKGVTSFKTFNATFIIIFLNNCPCLFFCFVFPAIWSDRFNGFNVVALLCIQTYHFCAHMKHILIACLFKCCNCYFPVCSLFEGQCPVPVISSHSSLMTLLYLCQRDTSVMTRCQLRCFVHCHSPSAP